MDSAVSAWLLKQQGYEVIGIFMKNWEDDDDSEYVPADRIFWMRPVADVIGIDMEHVNFAVEYKDRVFAESLREYQRAARAQPRHLVQRRDQIQGVNSRHAFGGLPPATIAGAPE